MLHVEHKLTDKFIKKAYPKKLYPLKSKIVGPHHRSRNTTFGISCLYKKGAHGNTVPDAENKTKEEYD